MPNRENIPADTNARFVLPAGAKGSQRVLLMMASRPNFDWNAGDIAAILDIQRWGVEQILRRLADEESDQKLVVRVPSLEEEQHYRITSAGIKAAPTYNAQVAAAARAEFSPWGRLRSPRLRVIRCLDDADEPLSIKDIVKQTRVGKSPIRAAIVTGKDNGFLDETEATSPSGHTIKLYELNETGRKAAKACIALEPEVLGEIRLLLLPCSPANTVTLEVLLAHLREHPGVRIIE